MQDAAPGRIRLRTSSVIAVVLLVIGAGLVSYYAYGYFTASRAKAPLSVLAGDEVYVNYTGQFTNHLVFDTSMLSVAQNNATFPKAPGFTWRGASAYKPLHITNVGSGQVIKGFDEALIGMTANQTKSVLIPPSLGYGPINTSLLSYLPLYQNISMVHTLTAATFQSDFGQSPYVGLVIRDPFWGWNLQVLSSGNGTATYQYQPVAGMLVYPYTLNSSSVAGLTGFPVKVLSISSSANNGTGLISIKNEITSSMVNTVGGKSPTGAHFIIYGINSNGTATLNFNQPVVGRYLLFTLTVTYISNPSTGKSTGIPGYQLYAADSRTEL